MAYGSCNGAAEPPLAFWLVFPCSARPWGNYSSDYRPLVEFAKEAGASARTERCSIRIWWRAGCTSPWLGLRPTCL